MAGTADIRERKRSVEDSRERKDGPFKKRRKQQMAYHSSDAEDDGQNERQPTKRKAAAALIESISKGKDVSEDDGEDDSMEGFEAVGLSDSDEEGLDSALVDDGATDDDDRDSDSSSGDDNEQNSFHDSLDSLDSLDDDSPPGGAPLQKPTKAEKLAKRAQPTARDAPSSGDADDADDGDSNEEDDDESLAGSDDEASSQTAVARSKRNDPAMFATSLHKILGTKLSTTRRADPVLARSAAAREASRRVVDAALEDKARRQLRQERRAALDQGRVKDVLVATNRPTTDGSNRAETTASVFETERRLRKVAQRGVVKLFNAVRAAQVQAASAQRQTRAQGVLGMDKREAKVAAMSRKGFLDLIASGGGGLKKGGLEEA